MVYRIQDRLTGTTFDCGIDDSLLKAMQRSGQKIIPVGCLGGGCGFCKIKIVDGEYKAKKMSKRHISTSEQGEKYALACRIYPQSDLLFEVEFTE